MTRLGFSFLGAYQHLAVDNPGERRIESLPLFQQLIEDALAVAGEAVEAFVALLLFAPHSLTRRPWLSKRRRSG